MLPLFSSSYFVFLSFDLSCPALIAVNSLPRSFLPFPHILPFSLFCFASQFFRTLFFVICFLSHSVRNFLFPLNPSCLLLFAFTLSFLLSLSCLLHLTSYCFCLLLHYWYLPFLSDSFSTFYCSSLGDTLLSLYHRSAFSPSSYLTFPFPFDLQSVAFSFPFLYSAYQHATFFLVFVLFSFSLCVELCTFRILLLLLVPLNSPLLSYLLLPFFVNFFGFRFSPSLLVFSLITYFYSLHSSVCILLFSVTDLTSLQCQLSYFILSFSIASLAFSRLSCPNFFFHLSLIPRRYYLLLFLSCCPFSICVASHRIIYYLFLSHFL